MSIMIIIFKAGISLCIAGAGVYVLFNVNKLSKRLQNTYVKQAEKHQEKGGVSTYLFIYNPETWKTPFATLMFKGIIIFFGIWLILVAYPIVFGAIQI